jgi:prevent-host-death family protein
MTLRAVRIAEDFVPVSEFKAQAADLLRKIATRNAPMIVTVNGKPAGVLLSPSAFDELTERARLVEAITQGIADADSGRVRPHADVVAHMRARRARAR